MNPGKKRLNVQDRPQPDFNHFRCCALPRGEWGQVQKIGSSAKKLDGVVERVDDTAKSAHPGDKIDVLVVCLR